MRRRTRYSSRMRIAIVNTPATGTRTKLQTNQCAMKVTSPKSLHCLQHKRYASRRDNPCAPRRTDRTIARCGDPASPRFSFYWLCPPKRVASVPTFERNSQTWPLRVTPATAFSCRAHTDSPHRNELPQATGELFGSDAVDGKEVQSHYPSIMR